MIFTLVLAALLVLTTITAINLKTAKNNAPSPQQTLANNNPESTPVIRQQASPSALNSAKNLIPSPKPGFKQYLDENLKYGFNYQDSLSITKQTSRHDIRIEAISLKIEPLDTFLFSPSNPETSLLTNDLYCDAAGPTGSIECETTGVENFTNSLGFKGFKVSRAKTLTSAYENIPAEVYQDVVYVFPLQEIVTQGAFDFSGILLAIDTPAISTPAESDLLSLEKIANEFFSF